MIVFLGCFLGLCGSRRLNNKTSKKIDLSLYSKTIKMCLGQFYKLMKGYLTKLFPSQTLQAKLACFEDYF